MFIHIWMHWFWITAAYLKGFLLFAVHTISAAEAGLLNDTFTTNTPNPYNDSSQTDPPHVVSPITPHDTTHSPHTMPYVPTAPILQDDPVPILQDDPAIEQSTPTRPDDALSTAFASTSDLADTFNGGPLDAFQYPLKKPTKHAHPKKSERAKAKGKPADDALSDGVKIVEEKLNVNITITEPEVDKPDDLPVGGTPDMPSTDASDVITTSVAVDKGTPEVLVTVKPSQAPPEDLEILKNETLVIESKVEETGSYTTVEPFLVKNRVAAATSAHNYEPEQSGLNPGSITGITLGILVVFSLFGAVSFVLYRRRYLNKPEVLHDKCSNLDSSGYIDETSLRENSEEMYSLDNDSFLNSLEAMTIQNYWTESVKHTQL